jgi:hypothetical protein
MASISARRLAHAPRVAFVLLVVFLVAVLGALGVTLSSVAPDVALTAAVAVVPIVALTVVVLYFEHRGRSWSYGGAAALGAVGVVLRLVLNAHPQLEVGGGLPIEITALYLAIGLSLIGASLWALVSVRRDSGAHGPPR